MEEIWKDIPEFEGLYQISNLGNISKVCLGRGAYHTSGGYHWRYV